MTATKTAPFDPNADIAADDFDYLRVLVRTRSGIELEENHQYLVESRLPPIARQHSLTGIAELMRLVRRQTAKQLEIDVIDAMTTNETSFFRDQHPFADLTEYLIPELLDAKAPGDPLTIWCAASSSGQEPYTLAILLNENFPDLISDQQVRIIATDLSRTMARRTAEGRYSQFEVNRGLPAKYLVKYFEQDGREWVISEDLRNLVTTEEVNLLETWAPVPRCDLVLLRNVLIYFSIETKREILRRVRTDVLRPHGYLMLGSSETLINLDEHYEKRPLKKGSCYRPIPEAR